jgi:hypothetical protein
MSSHPQAGEQVSDLVLAIAVQRDLNPVDLQRLVRIYAGLLRHGLRAETAKVAAVEAVRI